MTSTQHLNFEAVAAEQRFERTDTVAMLVDVMGITVAEARQRVANSIRADIKIVNELGCRDETIAVREAADAALLAEWGL